MKKYTELKERIQATFCRMFHRRAWPINHQYTCPDCLQSRAVNW